MKLKEFEAKQLLEKVGISTSWGILIKSLAEIPEFTGPLLLKAQTLAGGRGKAGGVLEVEDQAEAREVAQRFFSKNFLGEEIKEILLDEMIPIEKEFYFGIMFDTSNKCPVLIAGKGGVDAEDLPKIITPLNFNDAGDAPLGDFLSDLSSDVVDKLKEIIKKLVDCFQRFDCRMIEINPLVLTPHQELIAVDAVAVLDDDAQYRREILFSERTNNRKATAREIAAREIDRDNYRGVAGKTFIELGGDIAILTSGGGATMTLMDAFVESSGKPANFTEYSGNPPAEKVEKLTRVVLDKEGLSGLLVAGVIANFTDIAETLRGVLEVLVEKKPKYPIVIRRAGPNDHLAKEMLMKARQEHGLDIHYYGEEIPLTKAVEILVDLSEQYKQKRGAQ